VSVQLYLGDCRDVMASMEPDTFDSIVTDPPYGLAFMGKDREAEYLEIARRRIAAVELPLLVEVPL